MRLIYSSKSIDEFQIVLNVVYDSSTILGSDSSSSFEQDFDTLFESIKEYIQECGFTIKRERTSNKSVSRYLDVFFTVDPTLKFNILVNMRISDHKNYNLKTFRIANRKRATRWKRQLNIDIKQREIEIVVDRNDEDGIYKGLEAAINKIDDVANEYLK